MLSSRYTYGLLLLLACVVMLWTAPSLSAEQVTDEVDLNWKVTGAGGATGSSGGYTLSGTVGQTATLTGVVDGQELRQGFWQSFEQFQCGDMDGNGYVNISDVLALVTYVFGYGPLPTLSFVADTDCNGQVNISDAVYVISFIFQDGNVPCANCD